VCRSWEEIWSVHQEFCGRAGEAFFQVLGCAQARASTAFTTVGWGMSHDHRQHMGDGHDTLLDRLAQHFQDVTPTRREFFQTIRSGVRATPCPASTPVRYSSGQPTHTQRARCPRSAARPGPIWRPSASLPGRTRVLAGPGHDHQQPRVRRLPSGTCCSSPGSRWGADEALVVAPPPGGGTGGVPQSLERPLLSGRRGVSHPCRSTTPRTWRRHSGNASSQSTPGCARDT